LKEIGLTEKEVDVYLELVELGCAAASVAGNRVGLARSTAKYTCQSLLKKGLIYAKKENGVFIYSPESPDKISYLLEQRKKEIEEQEGKLGRVISELKSKINPELVLPRVQFFEGKKGFVQAYKIMAEQIKPNSEILSYTNPVKKEDDNFDIKDTMWGFIRSRIEKKVTARLIGPVNDLTLKLKRYDKDDLRETRLVHENNY
jgi:sugar-specific transcriptional regulator TrmB